jgi:hypothetical protein
MLQSQREEDCANSAHNPHGFQFGQVTPEIVAIRDVSGREDLAGDRPRAGQPATQWHQDTGTFAVLGSGECRLIRLENVGRSHFANDILAISAWEIFGSLIE